MGRRFGIKLIASIAVVTAAAGCGSHSGTSASVSSGTSSTRSQEVASAIMGADGATVTRTVDGMRVTATAPAGAAAAGTSFTISDAAAPGKAFPVAVASSAATKLVLGEGQQPKQPIELTFDLSGQPDLASRFNDTVKPIVRSISAEDGSVSDFAVADWDPAAKTVRATTDHLSTFQVIAADIGKAFQQWANGVVKGGQPSQESTCASNNEVTIGSTKYTLSASKPSGPVKGCLRNADGRIAVDLTNGSDQYFGVTSSPAGEFSNPAMLHSDDRLAVWLLGRLGDRSGLLTPKSDGTLTLPATAASIQADVDPAALQLKTVFTGLDMLGIGGDALSDVFKVSTGAWDCITTAFDSATRPAKPNVDEFIKSLGDVSKCGLSVADVGGVGDNFVMHRLGVATSLFASLPGQLVANVSGVIGEATGDNHVGFTIKADESSQPPPAPTGALVPLVLKSHGSPGDSGNELGPNHFQLGHKLKDDHGNFYVSLDLRWKTSDDNAVYQYCTEHSKVVDTSGNIVVERHQDLGGGCAYGGGWGFNISAPGSYTYILDVENRDGDGSVHAEQQFVVDP